MLRIIQCLCLLDLVSGAEAFDVSDYRLVDLTHAYDESTLYWPT